MEKHVREGLGLAGAAGNQASLIPLASLKTTPLPFFVRSAPLRRIRRLEKFPEAFNAPISIEEDGDFFSILDGHCRVVAAKNSGRESIPAIIRRVDNDSGRFKLIWEANNDGPQQYDPYEMGRLFAVFHKRGLSATDLSHIAAVSFDQSEDLIELGRFPSSAGRWIHETQWPVWAALMLLRRQARWSLDGRLRSAARTVRRLAKTDPGQISDVKKLRFLLDFYWSGNRPASFHRFPDLGAVKD